MTTDCIPYENGSTVGAIGSEDGTILRDELHPDGARITLEQMPTRSAITCGRRRWCGRSC